MAKGKRVKIGTVGVDAGMIYIGDPCYFVDKPIGKKPWDKFLNDMYASRPEGEEANWWTVRSPMANPAYDFPAGMVTTTGWGDGEYPVEVTLNEEGRVASLTITFIRDAK